MTNSIRVHKFAKDNSCKSKDVLEVLHEMGHEEIRAPNSNIPLNLVEKLKKKIQPFPINKISVSGLWNQTDIILDLTNGLTSIINGPNGVGKTSFLNLIKEIFHNRNFLEETAPLRKTVFKEIKIFFTKLGTLKISKNYKNQIIFHYDGKKREISSKDVYYTDTDKISHLLGRYLRKDCGWCKSIGRFITIDNEEIVLTDTPKFPSGQINLKEIKLGSKRPAEYVHSRRRYPMSWLDNEEDKEFTLENLSRIINLRWKNLDSSLRAKLDCVKITDIPTRRERAVNILSYYDKNFNQKATESVEGISLRLRDELNIINLNFLKKKNKDNSNLGNEFFNTALSYEPIPNFKGIEKEALLPMFDKNLQKGRDELRQSIDELAVKHPQLDEKGQKLFTKLFNEWFRLESHFAKSALSPFLIPLVKNNGAKLNKSIRIKNELKDKGLFYHTLEKEINIDKLITSSDGSNFWGLVFLTPYLKTIVQSKSSPIEEIQIFALKIENFLNMVNEQYGLLNKKLSLKKEPEDLHLLQVTSTIDDRNIPLEVLSSGEKHVIILCYLLAFVEKDHLLLIDEPEISMHVEWKENFIGNLNRCLDTTMSKSIIATHSPTLARAADAEEIFYFEPSN